MDDDLLLGKLALEKGLLKPEDLEKALAERAPTENLGQVLQAMGVMDGRTVDTLRREARAHPPPTSGRIGKYVLSEELGRGGMGVVHKAWDPELGRPVAIKTILETRTGDSAARLRREAQTAAKLSHPHIVPIHEVGEHEGRPYLVMKLIDGQPLHKLRLERRVALNVLRDAAEAVHHANEEGIVHRDLKPDNLMLDRSGHVWVTDFGLAREVLPGSTMTEAGIVMGTPAYMAPEQTLGARCDRRSDVYSLGATLYQLMTGRPPYEGESPLRVFRKVTDEDPVPPRRRNREIPREVETIILKAMERDPASRYPTAKALAEDIGLHLEGKPIQARPSTIVARLVKRVRRHPATSALVGVMVLGILAAAGFLIRSRVHLARKISDLRRKADAEEAAGRHGEAIKALQSILAHNPSQEWVRPKIRELELRQEEEAGRADVERRRRQARALIEVATKNREACERERVRVGELECKVRTLAATFVGPEPPAEKRPLWNAQAELEEARRSERDLLGRSTSALVQAFGIGVEPERGEARALLAETYWTELRRAETRGQSDLSDMYEKLVRQYDDEPRTFAARLDAPGAITVTSNPEGSEISLYRYEPREDRRLTPKEHAAGPSIPQGSYLMILKKQGFRDVRYPVFVGRGSTHAAKVNLYTDEEIGLDFVYVPAGKFVMGGDPGAYPPNERNEQAETGDFFIARREVTMIEYVEFLNALLAAGKEEEARRRMPRYDLNGPTLWTLPPGCTNAEPPNLDRDFPIIGISWEDADAYCRRRGWRLPTSLEWEKAARGVDGRFFPWGDHFDWTFAKGGRSRAGKGLPEPVGTFAADESPYGIRDAAGGVREWCGDFYDLQRNLRPVCGGAWTVADAAMMRAASRVAYDPKFVNMGIGFRPVRDPPRR